jgi:Mg/Co/Ni transporter MgtE
MNAADPLLLRFAGSRPREVALLLAAEPAEDSGPFLETLPPAPAAEVLSQLSSQKLAEILTLLDPAVLSRILLAARRMDQLTLLSHIPSSAYGRIAKAAGGEAAAQLRRLFDAPARNLAALAQPDFIRVEASSTCAEIKQELEARKSDAHLPLFVVDSEAVFRGIVSPLAVLPARNAGLTAAEVLEPVEPLSGNVRIHAALAAKQWRRHAMLPVVDTGGRVLGAVSREQLESTRDSGDRPSGLESLVESASAGYLALCAELLDFAIGMKKK